MDVLGMNTLKFVLYFCSFTLDTASVSHLPSRYMVNHPNIPR